MHAPLKIAVFHNLPSGGAKRALYGYVEYLTKTGNEVDVFVPSTANEDFLPLKGVASNVHVFPVATTTTGSIYSTLKYIPPNIKEVSLRDLEKTEQRIAEIINKGQYDVVFSEQDQYTMAPFLLKYLKKPLVYYCQQPLRNDAVSEVIFPRKKKNLLGSLMGIGSKIVVKRGLDIDKTNSEYSNYTLSNSYFSRESILRMYGINSHVSYLGVDPGMFKPLEVSKESYILSVGTFTPEKGHGFLVDSLSMMDPEIRPKLIVVSNSSYPPWKAYLIKHAEELGVNMEILSLIKDKELAVLYNQAEIVVYSPYLELFGLVPLESMACGTPVVAVKEGGVRETVIHKKTGLLVDRDEELFADAVTKMLSKDYKRYDMGKKSVQTVKNYWTNEHAGERLCGHLSRVINKDALNTKNISQRKQ
jgi:glycosyltransferase involved in cell wall biosynthesis